MLQSKDIGWLNEGPSICCLQETHFRSKDRLKVKGWKNIFHANGNKQTEKAGVAILI